MNSIDVLYSIHARPNIRFLMEIFFCRNELIFIFFIFDKKQYKLDTPVLVDIEHGSVRYRYGSYEGEPVDKARRIERPFHGDDKVNKQNYFYHARLNDFSESM